MTGKISSDFIEADGAVEKADQGTLILNNDSNDFTGRFHVNQGFAKVTSIGNIGEASAIGAVRSNFSDFHIRVGNGGTDATPLENSGTLSYIGTSDESTDRIVRIGNSANSQSAPGSNGGGTISNDSPNNSSLQFTNAIFNDPEDNSTDRISARRLSLEGTSTAINTINGVISDNWTGVIIDETVSINVDTSGTWQLDGVSTYTGNTTVNGGTLRVNGSLASASPITVFDNGTLAGSGTIGGNVSFASGATHTGGNTATAAVQTLSGDVSYASGATVSLNLVSNSTTVGQFDQFAVGGNLSFGTSSSNDLNLEISFGDNVNIEDPFWDNGAFTNEWKVWDYTTLATNFADSDFTLSLSADSTGAALALIRADAFEIANNNFANDNAGVWLRQIAPIPEPSTYALMGLGLAAFGWFSRRRRQKRSE
tara:strand:- start:9790 stop:11064 length:1275 start_codon:yes stop_codon:yes gene_type:complete